ncbi:MAG: repeat-containing protein [Bacteroidota bacterium]|jgi:alpha-tubulin suppressor-like RCC1 family protein|nr:repeat-containing protein [Bacteroidota bacterium]
MKHNLQKSFLLSMLALMGSSGIAYSQSISASVSSSMFLCADNTAMGVGSNNNGNLGDGTTVDRLTAVQASSLTDIKAIGVGFGFTLFLKNDGTVWACGTNYQGQLGQGSTGSTTPISTPVQINALSGIVAVSAAQGSSLFLKNDSTVWACGNNYYGQLGDGTTINRGTPFQIPSLSGIAAIASGGNHSLFLKGNGTVLACGYNYHGQLGRGTSGSFAPNPTPVIVNVVSGITKIIGGGYHSLFLKNDGTVWACGGNNYGGLGDGTTVNRSTPFQIGSVSSITAMGAGDNHSVFLKNDGTVWATGLNGSGQLGDGTTTDKTTPVQVSSLSGITAISGGYAHTLYLKSDSTVWGTGDGWGLGDGTSTNRSTPVQISNICSVVTVGVEENMAANEVLLYPNPGTDHFTIEVANDQNTEVAIYNGTGQMVYSSKLRASKTEIEIDALSSGIYFVQIKNSKGVSVKKLIKN